MARRFGAILLTMLIVGCNSSASPAPGTPTPSSADGLSTPTTPSLGVSSGASGSPGQWSVDGVDLAALQLTDEDLSTGRVAPLPPTLFTNAYDIADALYQPDEIGAGIVSLLDMLGIPIVDASGAVIRSASGTPAANLSLTEDEVRGLIAMGTEDASITIPGMPGGSPYTFADLASALSAHLPSLSVQAMADAYQRAYDEHPEGLIAQIFGRQPITPELGLTRVHMWLLLIDGFVGGRDASAAARIVSAQSLSPSWGTANPYLPNLVPPAGRLSPAGFAILLAHLPLVAFSVPFTMSPPASGVHEGHGGPGQPTALTTQLQSPAPPGLVDPVTGADLFPLSGGSASGIVVQWSSSNADVLDAHGTLDQPLDVPVATDGGGAVTLGYEPRQEAANGIGDIVDAVSTIRATVPLADLVMRFFNLDPGTPQLVFGARSVQSILRISWHEPAGLRIRLSSLYNVDALMMLHLITPNFDMDAERSGIEFADGFLARDTDGVYRGTVRATILVAKLHIRFGETSCDADASSGFGQFGFGQWLNVVGQPVTQSDWAGHPQPVFAGTPGSEVVWLQFYPASAPASAQGSTPPWCLAPIVLQGSVPRVEYAPFNGSQWTDPNTGYTIYTPSEGALSYLDTRFVLTGALPGTNQLSMDGFAGAAWDVVVTRTGQGP